VQKIFLFLKGYIYIKVTGFAPERFVNLCGNRGIFLWDILVKENVYYMHMKARDFFQIAPLVRKTKTKVVLLKRIGLPFLLPEIYKRKMFMFGFVVTIFLWYCSSFFVWKINIQGNSIITTEDILRTLSEVGISVGDRYGEIEYEELEKYIRKKYDTIIWISMKQNGTIIDLSLKENQIVSFVENKDESPCNIVASEDGIIHSIVVRKGIPAVSPGAEVKKGDVLVRGEIPIYNDDGTLRNKSFVKADADIFIENIMPVHITLPKIYTKREYTGRYKKNFKVIMDSGHVIKSSIPVHYLYKDEICDKSDKMR
jgi:similar to stage IV sporulation protein